MNDLSSRIKEKTNILMVHGELDQIVPSSNLLEKLKKNLI